MRIPRAIAPLILAMCALGLSAQGPGRPPMRHYGNEDGLTSEVVTAMAQTPDGRIWAATEAGLVMFDGQRFATFEGALPSPILRDLFPEQDGTLWVATDAGLARINQRTSAAMGPAQGLPRGSCIRVGRDRDGHLWVLVSDGLFVENGSDRFVPAPALPVFERPGQIFVDPALPGVLVLTGHHLLAWRGGRWEVLQEPPAGPKEELLNVAMDGAGGIWVRSSHALWHRAATGPWVRVKSAVTGGFSFSSRMDRDSKGWVWFDDVDGLWRVKGDQRERYGRSGDDARGGMVDQEDGIWIRTDHGIQRSLGRSRWSSYDMRDGLATNLIWQPVRDRAGRLWVATDKGLCVSTSTGFETVLPGRILTLALAPDGRLWVSGSPGGTVYELDPDRRTIKTHVVDVLPRGRITAGLAVDSQGIPWVADQTQGLACGVRAGQGWTWKRVTIDGVSPGRIMGITALPDGDLAVLHDDTASILHQGVWRRIPDLLPATPSTLAAGPGGRLAIGYRNPHEGLAVVTLHRLQNGLAPRTGIMPVRGGQDSPLVSVFSVAMDGRGRLWIGTNKGLGRADADAPGSFHMIGMEDRLVSPECNEGAILAEAGRVWLGTTSGLASFNSDLPTLQPTLKEPLLLWARAGQLVLNPEGPAPTLPRRANMMEIRYMIPTYQAPGRIQYEARLHGVDPSWVRTEDGHIRYAGLAVGRHTLDLRGVLPDWNLEGPTLTLHFTIRPAWYETAWAQALGLLLLGAGIWMAFWLRQLALQSRNRQLQEEVARQTRALQEASRAKSAFLANMSHELRTPLNAILLYAELLQEEARDRGLDSTLEDAAKIHQAGSALLGLIDGILDISKIEAGHMRLDLEDMDLGAFLARLDTALRPVVERQGNSFEILAAGAPDRLRCDPVRLQQILANLLGNAAKFTEGGRVTLTADRDGRYARFEVADTGIGMTPEEQSKVFNEFVQADSSTTRKYGGTGLGLTLVRRLTDMLGGRVEMQSAPGVGTRIRVCLPCDPTAPPAPVG